MPPQFVELLDLVTVSQLKRIVGRINVNEAPAEVLMTLPGMTEDTVESILSSREDESSSFGINRSSSNSAAYGEETRPPHANPVWLLTEGYVDLPTMRQLWPFVTCGGDVYRAEIWGRVDSQSPMVRFETVLDASAKECRPVYYRELAAPRGEVSFTPPLDALGIDSTTSYSPTNNTSPRRTGTDSSLP